MQATLLCYAHGPPIRNVGKFDSVGHLDGNSVVTWP